jgi:hypothetical protein
MLMIADIESDEFLKVGNSGQFQKQSVLTPLYYLGSKKDGVEWEK